MLRNRLHGIFLTAILGISILFVMSDQLKLAFCQSEGTQDKALVYIQQILPLDITQCSVAFQGYIDNSNSNSSSTLIQRFTYKLTNDQTELTVFCTFNNGVPVALEVRNVIGSITSYSDNELIGVTKQVVEKHELQTQTNLTEFTLLLDQLSSQVNASKIYGKEIMLSVSHALIPSGLTTENGHIHISSAKPMSVTKFEWYYLGTVESASNMILNQNTPIFQVTYMNGAFYSLYDNQYWVKQSPAISSSTTPITEQSEEFNQPFLLTLLPSILAVISITSAGIAYIDRNRKLRTNHTKE